MNQSLLQSSGRVDVEMSLCYQWPIRPEIHQGAHGGERVDRNTSGLGLCQLTDVTGDPER